MSLTAALHGHLVPRGAPDWLRRVPAFVGVGVGWTIAYLGLYWLLRLVVDAQVANVVALVVTTLGGTDGHRRITFRVSDHTTRSQVLHQAAGLLLLLVGLALTSGSLWLLHAVAPTAPTSVELAALLVANGLSGCTRFAVFAVLMRPHDRSGRALALAGRRA